MANFSRRSLTAPLLSQKEAVVGRFEQVQACKPQLDGLPGGT